MFTAKGKKLMAEKENNKEALDIDPCAVAWILKRKNKLISGIVGHVPRKTFLFIWLFFSLCMVEKWRQMYYLFDHYHPRS